MNGCRFPLRPPPFSLESETGYYIRVAQVNGYASGSVVSRMGKGQRVPGFGNRGGNVVKLAAERQAKVEWSLALDPGTLERMWPTAIGRKRLALSIGHLSLDGELVHRGITRICPECVTEDGYSHAAWEVRMYLACHKHHRLLVSECPRCTKPLSAVRPSLLHCSCGYQLVLAPKTSAAPEAIAVAELVAAGIQGAKPEVLENFGPLANGSIESRLWALYAMGWMLDSTKSSIWLNDRHSHPKDHQPKLVTAYRAFHAWPNRWIEYMDRRAASAKTQGAGWVNVILRRELTCMGRLGTQVPTLDDELRQWIYDRYPGSNKGYPKCRAKDLRLSVSEVAEELDCSESAIRNLIRRGELKAVKKRQGGQVIYFVHESEV